MDEKLSVYQPLYDILGFLEWGYHKTLGFNTFIDVLDTLGYGNPYKSMFEPPGCLLPGSMRHLVSAGALGEILKRFCWPADIGSYS